MKSATSIGRVGGLAVALGVGAWLASVPWLAAADPDTSGLDATALDPSALLGSAAADPSGLDFAVSYDGMTLFHMGDATATTPVGGDNLAIAYGDGSVAESGTYTADGITSTGTGDYAFADGAGSTAVASGGASDSATASDGATAYSGPEFDPYSADFGPTIGPASYDSANASGAGSVADAGGGDLSFNTATASDGGTADSGFGYTPPATGTVGTLYDGGIGDHATASGAGTIADAGYGNGDIASVSGTDSTALAGGIGSTTLTTGNFDFAGAFGNSVDANATPGSDLFQIALPFGDFGPDAAGAVPSDDLGLSTLLADFSWLGL
jgi:hypothetical protein